MLRKKVRSARGVTIDFDELRIKQQLIETPKPTSVKTREEFIDKKLNRRLKKLKRNVVKATKTETDKKEEKTEE